MRRKILSMLVAFSVLGSGFTSAFAAEQESYITRAYKEERRLDRLQNGIIQREARRKAQADAERSRKREAFRKYINDYNQRQAETVRRNQQRNQGLLGEPDVPMNVYNTGSESVIGGVLCRYSDGSVRRMPGGSSCPM